MERISTPSRVAEAQRKRREEDIASALYRALRHRNAAAYVEMPKRGSKSLIDGEFDLVSVARRLLAHIGQNSGSS